MFYLLIFVVENPNVHSKIIRVKVCILKFSELSSGFTLYKKYQNQNKVLNLKVKH